MAQYRFARIRCQCRTLIRVSTQSSKTVARWRSGQAATALIVFIAINAVDTSEGPSGWWLWVGVGICFSAALVEPHYTSPANAALNSLGGLGAYFSADRSAAGPLWVALLSFSCLVLVSTLIVLIGPTDIESRLAPMVMKMGRAAVIGIPYLIVDISRRILDHQHYVAFAISVGALALILLPNWAKVFLPRLALVADSSIREVIGPSMLLVSSAKTLNAGDSVSVTGDAGVLGGLVVGVSPHQDGVRYKIVVNGPWTSLSSTGVSTCEIDPMPAGNGVAGIVIEGTTNRSVVGIPIKRLGIGETHTVEVDGNEVLYQITSQWLERATWRGTDSVEPRFRARQLGVLVGDEIRVCDALPKPFQLIQQNAGLTTALSPAYRRIGTVKGTDIPVGIAASLVDRGHLAILGMSGMGKTTVAHRICTIMESEAVVIVLDDTGEYRLTLGVAETTSAAAANLTSGFHVFKPGGDPPSVARAFIEAQMRLAAAEYEVAPHSADRQRRVIALEEAHTFLPEWNVATRDQQNDVAVSGKLIMQARKFLLSFMIISQRTAVVSKSALSQCENFIIFRTIDDTGLGFLECVVGPELRDTMSSLDRYEAVCAGPAFNTLMPVVVTLDPPSPVPLPNGTH